MQWSNLTFRPRNHVQFYVFEKNIGVRESQNSNSRNHKTEIFIDNVPFTLHPLVGLLPNSTTSKELTIWPSYCLQKRALKLVSWLPEVEDFLFLPLCQLSTYTAVHQGLSKYLTAQDTHISPTSTNHIRTLSSHGSLLSLQSQSTKQEYETCSVPSIE